MQIDNQGKIILNTQAGMQGQNQTENNDMANRVKPNAGYRNSLKVGLRCSEAKKNVTKNCGYPSNCARKSELFNGHFIL